MMHAPLETVLLSLESGARPRGGVSAESGEIPSLGGEHLTDEGDFDFSDIKRIPRPFFEAMRGGVIARLDILVVKDGATSGKTSLVRENFPFKEAAVNEHVFCLRVDPKKALPGYVYHFLRSARGQRAIQLDFRGATVGGISREFATKAILPLPGLPEQRRIVDILDLAEALRAKRHSGLALLHRLLQAIFVDLFVDEITSQKKWPAMAVGDLCERIIDCPHSTPAYAPRRTSHPCVRSSDIQEGYINLAAAKFVECDEYRKRIARGRPKPGDIIYCREGARFGNVARFMGRTQLCLGQRMMLFRPKPNVVTTEYLWAFLMSPAGYRAATSAVGGSASPHVNIRDIVNFRLLVPPLDLQQRFAQRVIAIDKLRAGYQNFANKLGALFASLQHRAFRGEL